MSDTWTAALIGFILGALVIIGFGFWISRKQLVEAVPEKEEPALVRDGAKFILYLDRICYTYNALAPYGPHYSRRVLDSKSQQLLRELKSNSCTELTVSFLGYIPQCAPKTHLEPDTKDAVSEFLSVMANNNIGLHFEMEFAEPGMNIAGSTMRREILMHLRREKSSGGFSNIKSITE